MNIEKRKEWVKVNLRHAIEAEERGDYEQILLYTKGIVDDCEKILGRTENLMKEDDISTVGDIENTSVVLSRLPKNWTNIRRVAKNILFSGKSGRLGKYMKYNEPTSSERGWWGTIGERLEKYGIIVEYKDFEWVLVRVLGSGW